MMINSFKDYLFDLQFLEISNSENSGEILIQYLLMINKLKMDMIGRLVYNLL
jgi:hypothetical protein